MRRAASSFPDQNYEDREISNSNHIFRKEITEISFSAFLCHVGVTGATLTIALEAVVLELKKRFGLLVSANRRRLGMTQHQLAEAADLSDDMIAKIEVGTSGASFSSVESLAAALGVDPAVLFIPEPMPNRDMRRPLVDLTAKLSVLSDADLAWVSNLLEAALSARGLPKS